MRKCRKKLHFFEGERCLECKKNSEKKWRSLNKIHIKKRDAEFYLRTREERLSSMEKWRKKNKQRRIEYGRIYHYNKRHSDINYKLTDNLRARLNRALKGNYKSGSAVRDLGCTVPELKAYLESRFQPGMTWDNHGAWHLDHVRPLSSFDLTNPEQFRLAVHYTNLQPLWAEENLRKGANLE